MKQEASQLSSYEIPDYPLYKLYILAIISVCSCKHNSRWFASVCTNETHSIANLQDLIPTLATIIIGNMHKLAKVGIKSCRIAIECVPFVHTWSNQLPSWNCACINRHKQQPVWLVEWQSVISLLDIKVLVNNKMLTQ